MTPVNMIVPHDPPATYGDCLRACVASLLDMTAADVPHFTDGLNDEGGPVALDRLTGFLRPLGLYPLVLSVCLEHDGPQVWFDFLRGHYILQGLTEDGCEHCVIATGRATIAHDPSPTQPGVRPYGDGEYWVWLFVRLNQ